MELWFEKLIRKQNFKFIALGLITVAVIGSLLLLSLYSSMDIKQKKECSFYVSERCDIAKIPEMLRQNSIVVNATMFTLAAKILGKNQALPGHYRISVGMKNLVFINRIASANQSPITLTFNNIRTSEMLSQRLGAVLLADSADFMKLFDSELILKQHGFSPKTIIAAFIPNTYQVWWTSTPEELLTKMILEYNTFWNNDRKTSCQKIGMSQMEVVTLASIIDEESARSDEKPMIAGLYINRLKLGMKLQADPTVKFALRDFGKKRILLVDTEIDSPYNTYKYAGLPPGPIRMPAVATIDAVLNHAKHDFLFMVAESDFSGKHHFSTNYNEHLTYARKYQQALNRLNKTK